jgi:hypothetical protein
MVHKEGMSPKAAVNKAEHMFNAKWQAPKKSTTGKKPIRKR